jgi:hypothetical protein
MPTLTLQWQGPYGPVDQQWSRYAWILDVHWRKQPNTGQFPGGNLITQDSGIYIIENGAGEPVYAGQTENLRDRFDGRSSVLHELSLRSASLNGYSVWVSPVWANPPGYTIAIDRAEHWLIRYLSRRERGHPAQYLQNKKLTDTFRLPRTVEGLTITWPDVPNGRLGYLSDDPRTPGYMRPQGGPRYYYAPGDSVLWP